MPTCKSCGAEIIWAKTERGKNMPLDAQPVDPTKVDMTCFIEGGVAYFGAIDRPPGDLHYVSHYATCPNAASHRKPRTKPPYLRRAAARLGETKEGEDHGSK